MSLSDKNVTHNRIPVLDGIRGIAVLMVLFFHLFAWSMESGIWSETPWASWSICLKSIYYLSKPGQFGVELFFVMSGFLITSILLETKDHPKYFLNFYARRGLRILPLYYLVLFIIWLTYPNSTPFIFVSAIYLSNMSTLFGIPMLYGPLWSLSVEEHYYLVWPVIVRNFNIRILSVICLILILGSPLFRIFGYFADHNIFSITWFRTDSLSLGSLLAIVYKLKSAKWIRYLSWGVFAIVLLMVLLGLPYGIFSRKTILGAAFQAGIPSYLFFSILGLIIADGARTLSILLNNNFLSFWGRISYFAYLSHWLFMRGWDCLSAKYFDLNNSEPNILICIRAIVVAGVIAGTGYLSYRYFENPLLQLKSHFPYSPLKK